MTDVVALSELGRNDLAVAGGKAANLGALINGGFAVPQGFVVTTAAYDAYVTAHDLRHQIATLAATGDDARIRALFAAGLDPELRDRIAAAYDALGAGPVAVRSSATAEDLADASFAGQQDTYLNIEGLDALCDAVRRCWASLWTGRAMSYRQQRAIDPDEVSLAVVVQQMVPADAAGILFTADPTTGQRRDTVIDATFGLGEAAVGGDVSPDHLVVRDGVVVSRSTGDKSMMTVSTPGGGTDTVPTPAHRRGEAVLDDPEAVELAAIGRRIEAQAGAPQDIEWAYADGKFAIVQARPITALPEPIGPIPDDWSVPDTHGMYIRASIVEQMPDPLSPLFADLIRPAVRQALRGVFQRYLPSLQLPAEDIDFRTINGFAYYFYSTRGMARMLRATPQALLLLAGRGPESGVGYWRHTAHPAYARVVHELSAHDVTTRAASLLLADVEALVEAGATYYSAVQAVIPIAATGEIVFTALYNSLARRPGDPAAPTFVLGFESAPIRAEASLYDVAQWCRATPGVAQALLAEKDVPAEHRAEFDARLRDHLARFGHMTYSLDLVVPVPADDPGPVLAALRFDLTTDADPRARRAQLAAQRDAAQHALLDRVDPVRRWLLAAVLTKAQESTPIREDALADVGLGWPRARLLLREIGERLVAAGAMSAPDDVYWLTLPQLTKACTGLDTGQAPPSLQHDIDARREQWRGRRRAIPPDWLPREGLWYRMFAPFMPSVGEQEGSTLRGLGASGGRVTGSARLLRGPEDFAAMRSGEILVAPITTPAYTPFFAMATAVVTDIGGPLSHSSIVAREYGIPAVLGTGSATSRITDEMTITVDGDRGIVLLGDGDGDGGGDDRSSTSGTAAGDGIEAHVGRTGRRRRAAGWVASATAAGIGIYLMKRGLAGSTREET